MKGIKKSVDHLVSEKPSQLILGIIFVIYILLNVQTPEFLASAVDNLFGKVIVVAIAAVIFTQTNPVVGVLALVVAYQVIKTASVTTGRYAMNHYLPSEASKMKEMRSFNVDTVSTVSTVSMPNTAPVQVLSNNSEGALETEMVEKMAPLVMYGGDSTLDYKPILDGQHSAALLVDDI